LLASGAESQHSSAPRDFLRPSADTLRLYPFRFRDPVSGKWLHARYVAELDVIAALYRVWEIVGAPELRRPTEAAFTPWRTK
jgi:hypothetical protein